MNTRIISAPATSFEHCVSFFRRKPTWTSLLRLCFDGRAVGKGGVIGQEPYHASVPTHTLEQPAEEELFLSGQGRDTFFIHIISLLLSPANVRKTIFEHQLSFIAYGCFAWRFLALVVHMNGSSTTFSLQTYFPRSRPSGFVWGSTTAPWFTWSQPVFHSH